MPVREILVVDDDADIRRALHEFLQEEGYAVSEAPDGRVALGRLQSAVQGLVVLLDLTMPIMDGIAMLETVARHKGLLRRHAFVLVTAQAGRTMPLAMATWLHELGVPILPKPFDLDRLLVAVQHAESRLS